MLTPAIKRRFKLAAAGAASLLGAATLTAFLIPASASGSSDALLIGAGGNMEYICTMGLDHGVIRGYAPYYYAVNGCGTRVWLHGINDSWTYCINPYSSGYIPAYAQFPADAQVTYNHNKC